LSGLNNHAEIVKIRNELEEIKEELYDRWHEDKNTYLKRVDEALDNNQLRVRIYLAIDGIKSVKEIELEVKAPHVSVWRAFRHLEKRGLTRKVGSKSGSPIYAKRPWAKVLSIDEYVMEKYQVKTSVETSS